MSAGGFKCVYEDDRARQIIKCATTSPLADTLFAYGDVSIFYIKSITWFTGTVHEADVDRKSMDADFRILSNSEILLEVQGLERRIHYKSVTHISTTDDTEADIDNLVHKEKESANRSTENNAPASFVSNLSINNIRLEAFSVKWDRHFYYCNITGIKRATTQFAWYNKTRNFAGCTQKRTTLSKALISPMMPF